MERTYIIQHRPLPLHHWLHEHQRLVRSSLGLIIAILVVAIAAPTVSMVRNALAEQSGPFANGAEVISTAARMELVGRTNHLRSHVSSERTVRSDRIHPEPVAHLSQRVIGVVGEYAPSLCLVRQV